eukprot:TRINITY_DN4735_c1_g1_i3.p1 TRINITY_DN4735_c1_g1~~TRINITY_DN4735_c1_g1_i3.p1  ORF type:complete len:625 (+),score=122.41 TRINITY_DN4735_c1_g1_i3:168-2042(+)
MQRPSLVRATTTQFTKSGADAEALIVGCGCLALYEEDGKFYDALIKADLGGGYLTVTYTGYGLDRDLPKTSIKPKVAAPAQQQAPKRPIINGSATIGPSRRANNINSSEAPAATAGPFAGPSAAVSVPPRPTIKRGADDAGVISPRPHQPLSPRAGGGNGAASVPDGPMSAPVPRRAENKPPPSGVSAKALFNFKAAKPGDLTIRKGDIIADIEQRSTGWWRGSLNGEYGRFPANYVAICSDNNTLPTPPTIDKQQHPQQQTNYAMTPRPPAPAGKPSSLAATLPRPQSPAVVRNPPTPSATVRNNPTSTPPPPDTPPAPGRPLMTASAPVATRPRPAAVPKLNIGPGEPPAVPIKSPPVSPRNPPQQPPGPPPFATITIPTVVVPPLPTTPQPPTSPRGPRPPPGPAPPSASISHTPAPAPAPTPTARSQPPTPAPKSKPQPQPKPRAAPPRTLAAGDTVTAMWSEDGQWYAAVIDHAYDEDGVAYFDVTFTEYGNSETYLTADRIKTADSSSSSTTTTTSAPAEPAAAPGSLAEALALKKSKMNAAPSAGPKAPAANKPGGGPMAKYEPPPSSGRSGHIESALAQARVTQRALNMSVYMPQDKLQGVEDNEWEDDDDSCFDF